MAGAGIGAAHNQPQVFQLGNPRDEWLHKRGALEMADSWGTGLGEHSEDAADIMGASDAMARERQGN